MGEVFVILEKNGTIGCANARYILRGAGLFCKILCWFAKDTTCRDMDGLKFEAL
jgi:hypothetical protein